MSIWGTVTVTRKKYGYIAKIGLGLQAHTRLEERLSAEREWSESSVCVPVNIFKNEAVVIANSNLLQLYVWRLPCEVNATTQTVIYS